MLARLEYGASGQRACETFAPGCPSPLCTFYDITIGDNDVPCTGLYNCFDPDAKNGVAGVLSLSDLARTSQPWRRACAGTSPPASAR